MTLRAAECMSADGMSTEYWQPGCHSTDTIEYRKSRLVRYGEYSSVKYCLCNSTLCTTPLSEYDSAPDSESHVNNKAASLSIASVLKSIIFCLLLNFLIA